MAHQTLPLTHYWPWDGDEQKAVCGASMSTARHSLEPTCAACAAHLAAADDAVDAEVERAPLPLDADEANALTPRRPMSALGEDLFALASLHARLRLMAIRGGRR